MGAGDRIAVSRKHGGIQWAGSDWRFTARGGESRFLSLRGELLGRPLSRGNISHLFPLSTMLALVRWGWVPLSCFRHITSEAGTFATAGMGERLLAASISRAANGIILGF